jgi:RNA ligase
MTLHYWFPEINNISDVLPHIAGRYEFIVVHKDYGISVVNYTHQSSETFPPVTDDDYLTPAILRECRGLVFDTETGEIVSRRLSKFHNFFERPDTSVIDVSKPHQVLEKLDGSFISPIILPGSTGVRYISKMGLTSTSMQAETFAASHPEYDLFARHCISWDATSIFEWCSPENRIVVAYEEDALILLAVRDNRSGVYWNYDSMVQMADAWNIPCVKAVCPPLSSPAAFAEFEATVRAWEGAEGVVLTWDDGSRVKIKADAYVSLHRAKSLTENERDVVGLILDDKTDDLLPLLPDADKIKMEAFRVAVWCDIENFVYAVRQEVAALLEKGVTRKEFALTEGYDAPTRGAIFAAWNDPCFPANSNLVFQWTISFIRKNLGNRAAFESKARSILKSARWT